MAWAVSSRDRSFWPIGLARGKRTVKVIVYRLFHSPVKTSVTHSQHSSKQH